MSLTAGSGHVVEVSDLTVTFERGGRQIHALRGVSLSLGRGEVLGLVGESGSGKSVLGLSLLGLLPEQPEPVVTGRAVVCGTDMASASAAERREVRRLHLGAVFQDPMTSLNPTMRVGRQVMEAAGSEEAALDLLEAVGVPEPRRRFRSYPHQLSGGQRQRVMIAMAVAGSPSLVVADEPTTALDVTLQAQILRLLRRLCDDMGTSLLMVTHDLGVAAEVSDRIAVLYAGRMVESGEAAEMLRAPRHPYPIGLLRSRLLLDTDRSRPIMTLPGEPPDPRETQPGCAFAPRCQHRLPACEEAVPELRLVDDPSRADPATPWQVACIQADSVALKEHVADALQLPWPAAADDGRSRAATAVLASGVTKSFPARTGWRREPVNVLRGLDLEVLQGEVVALVGESGCGKSTLLRLMAGLDTPDGGSVELARGTRTQMVFQDAGASLTPWLSVGELVGERLLSEKIPAKVRAERVRAVLAEVGLPAEVAGAKAAQLSGGQRQRVALARAIVVRPEVLLCDEPTSALDVSLAATVLNLIGRIRRELGMAVVFVTHDLAAARMVADRVAVMYLGEIVEIGGADEVCSRPTHPYTRALLAAVPGLVALDGLDSPAGVVQIAGAELMGPLEGAFHGRC